MNILAPTYIKKVVLYPKYHHEYGKRSHKKFECTMLKDGHKNCYKYY